LILHLKAKPQDEGVIREAMERYVISFPLVQYNCNKTLGGAYMPAPAMPEERKRSASRHSLHVDRRERVTVTGMIDVISFDEESVIGETEMGVIIIRGGNLHVNKISLDNGEMAVSGEIDSVTYENPGGPAKAKSVLGRLFK